MTTLTKPTVTLQDQGLTLHLTDGAPAYFNYFWLRDNCPSSFDPQTRERSFDLQTLPAPPRATTADITDTHLVISWQGEDHISRHNLEFLATNSSGTPRPDPADLPRKPWFSDHYPNMQRFAQPELVANPAERAAWAKALLTDGVALVTEMPENPTGLEDTARLLGYIRASFFGPSFEVKTHIKPTNLAFTSKALEMHTDLPPEDLPPGIQYLHCLANSVAGGDSLFLDGLAVAEDFRNSNPEDFALLAETDIPFFCEHESFDMRARQRVIELNTRGEVTGLTISGHLQDVFDHDQRFLDRYYPAYWRFARHMHDPTYLMRFRLNAGECICFDNHRIVHGREAYSATSGDRHLRGCYTDRGELRSTYRALVAQGHA